MGLETVREEIIKNARKEEEMLLAEAAAESKRIFGEAEKKVQEMKDKNEAELKKFLEMMRKQEAASAELEAKKIVLEAKKNAVDKVFDAVRERVEMLPLNKRESFINAMLSKTEKEIDIGIIYCNKKDAKAIKRYAYKEAGIMLGLIAESKDGTIRVDYSFDALLQSIKESELQHINNMLFG